MLSLSNETAGRRQALMDCGRLDSVVCQHAALSGGRAVSGHADAMAQIGAIHAEGRATLASPEMAAAYDSTMEPALADASARMAQHAVAQSGIERQAVLQGELARAQHTAASDWRDPARFVSGLETIEQRAARLLQPDISAKARAVAISNALAPAIGNAIENAMAAGEPEFATHIFATWGSHLSLAARQTVVAQLTEAERIERLSGVISKVAGAVDVPVDAERGTRLSATPGAAVHAFAPGRVLEANDNDLTIDMPDGSQAVFRGLGLVHVAAGDLVTPAHVIGSAGKAVIVEHSASHGVFPDCRAAIDFGMVLGTLAEARQWQIDTVLQRISGQSGLSPADRDLAARLALKRMLGDREMLLNRNLVANRDLAILLQQAGARYGQAADLPDALADDVLPDQLSQIDQSLRANMVSACQPSVDNPLMLRLELLRRCEPEKFAREPLGQFVGKLNPADLTELASAQAGDGLDQGKAGKMPRNAILDQLALRQCLSTQTQTDEQLAAVFAAAMTIARLSHSDCSDTAVASAVIDDAIQMLRKSS